MLGTVNALDRGSCRQQTSWRPRTEPSREVQVAQAQAMRGILEEAAPFERRRREQAPTGVHSVSSLLKVSETEVYSQRPHAVARESLRANDVDEPADDACVEMLAALPDEDAMLHASEHNVVERSGKSQVIFEEIEERHCFIGGSLDSYAEYLRRPDLPRGERAMWRFVKTSEVKAYASMTVVPKKQPGHQRKILMQCAANYVFCDVRRRANHGLHGGGAFASLHAPSDVWSVSSFDEDNAFTRVVPPPWMWAWCAGPPHPGRLVW